jgi:tetratricopeptide (TPR) repeat protein
MFSFDELEMEMNENNAALEALLNDLPDDNSSDGSMDVATEAAGDARKWLAAQFTKLSKVCWKHYTKAKEKKNVKGLLSAEDTKAMTAWKALYDTCIGWAKKLQESGEAAFSAAEAKKAEKAAKDAEEKIKAQEEKEKTPASESLINDAEYLDLQIATENSLMFYNAALEASAEIAQEGLFSKPKTLEQMLSNVQKTVDKKCKTSEDCDDLLAKITGEETKFNTAIKTLQDATVKYQEDNDKKDLKATTKPVLKDLKKTCDILQMKDITDNAEEITEDELKKLRDFIVGAKDIIKKKAESFSGEGDDEGADTAEECGSCESFLAMLQGMDTDDSTSVAQECATFDDFMVAIEGIISPDQKQKWRIKGGEVAKSIKATIKEAKAAVKSKDYDQAINLYKKALKGYQGLLATANKIPDKQNLSGMKYTDGSDTYKGSAKTSAIKWCNKKISECQNAIQMIQDKKTKADRKAGAAATESALMDLDAVLEGLGVTETDDESPVDGLSALLNDDED